MLGAPGHAGDHPRAAETNLTAVAANKELPRDKCSACGLGFLTGGRGGCPGKGGGGMVGLVPEVTSSSFVDELGGKGGGLLASPDADVLPLPSCDGRFGGHAGGAPGGRGGGVYPVANSGIFRTCRRESEGNGEGIYCTYIPLSLNVQVTDTLKRGSEE